VALPASDLHATEEGVSLSEISAPPPNDAEEGVGLPDTDDPPGHERVGLPRPNSPEAKATSMRQKPNVVCSNYLAGKCRFGTKCRNLHEGDIPQAPTRAQSARVGRKQAGGTGTQPRGGDIWTTAIEDFCKAKNKELPANWAQTRSQKIAPGQRSRKSDTQNKVCVKRKVLDHLSHNNFPLVWDVFFEIGSTEERGQQEVDARKLWESVPKWTKLFVRTVVFHGKCIYLRPVLLSARNNAVLLENHGVYHSADYLRHLSAKGDTPSFEEVVELALGQRMGASSDFSPKHEHEVFAQERAVAEHERVTNETFNIESNTIESEIRVFKLTEKYKELSTTPGKSPAETAMACDSFYSAELWPVVKKQFLSQPMQFASQDNSSGYSGLICILPADSNVEVAALSIEHFMLSSPGRAYSRYYIIADPLPRCRQKAVSVLSWSWKINIGERRKRHP
jgi:hypothetical protein